MSTISVPLTPKLEEAMNSLIKKGYGRNKADVMRRALEFLTEEEAVQDVLRAEQELKDGKGLKGDLRKLAQKIS